MFKSKHIHRKGVIKVINRFNDFLSLSFLHLQNKICQDLKDVDKNVLDRMKLTVFRHLNPLKNIGTEQKCFSLYKELGIFKEPQTYEIGIRNFTDKEGVTQEKPVFGVSLSLRDQLQTLFSMPGLYDQILEYESYLQRNYRETGLISNVIQADIWQKYVKNIRIVKLCQ